MTWPFASLWNEAWTFDQFVERADPKHQELWRTIYKLARVPAWASEAAVRNGQPLRLVVLTEDWCGDAVNTIPILAKWAESARGVELRILRRDVWTQVMDRYLTNSSRSIPVVIVLNERMEELGWWGPRPRDLQSFVMEQLRAGRPKPEIYPETRRWYARDKGEATLREVLGIAGMAGSEPVPAAAGDGGVA